MVIQTLKELREKRQMTYKDVAEKVGISTAGYWQIENGKRKGSYPMMVKIAEVFNKTPDEIFLQKELTKG